MIEPNNIYHGDCYELIKQIPDKSIDLIYTDIPYEFVSGGGGGAFGTKNRKYHDEVLFKRYEEKKQDLLEKMQNAKDKSEYEKYHSLRSGVITKQNTIGIQTGIDLKILDEFVRVMKKVNCYIWCSKKQIIEILNYFVDKGCNYDVLVWCKTNCPPLTNNTFLADLEYCLFFREENVRLNDGYELKSRWYKSSTNKEDKNKFKHPTIKPIDLVERHIKHSSNEGDIVLDPFVGSGTTCVAAKKTNRNYIGFEIDKNYHEIATKRLAKEEANGQTYLFD